MFISNIKLKIPSDIPKTTQVGYYNEIKYFLFDLFFGENGNDMKAILEVIDKELDKELKERPPKLILPYVLGILWDTIATKNHTSKEDFLHYCDRWYTLLEKFSTINTIENNNKVTN